jgi:hypothetical protein
LFAHHFDYFVRLVSQQYKKFFYELIYTFHVRLRPIKGSVEVSLPVSTLPA